MVLRNMLPLHGVIAQIVTAFYVD